MSINNLFLSKQSIQTKKYYYPVVILVFISFIQTGGYSPNKAGMWSPRDSLDLIMEYTFPYLTPLTTSDGVVYYDYRFADVVNKKCSDLPSKKPLIDAELSANDIFCFSTWLNWDSNDTFSVYFGIENNNEPYFNFFRKGYYPKKINKLYGFALAIPGNGDTVIYLASRINNDLIKRTKYVITGDTLQQAQMPYSELFFTSRSYFMKHKKSNPPLQKNNCIYKVGRTITLKTMGGIDISFVDDTSNREFHTFEYYGNLANDSIVVIKRQDYHTDRYFAINIFTGNIDTLIGEPHVYGNSVACLQGYKTDADGLIQNLEYRNADLQLKMVYYQKSDEIRADAINWKSRDELLLNENNERFWLLKLKP